MSVHSKEYSRVLSDYNHAASFLRNSLHLNEEISEHEFDEAVMAVASVEMGTERVLGENTLNSRAYRLPSYITDDSRVKLRKQIFDELKSKKRLDDDEKITLGKGGAIPKTPLQKNRQAFYVIGLPASGKSEISSILSDNYGAIILDSDYAKRKFPEFKTDYGATVVHEESSIVVFGGSGKYATENSLLKYAVERGCNIVIPKIGDVSSKVFDFSESLSRNGYHVHLILVRLDREKAVQRAFKRFSKTKRYVPLSLIFDVYSNDPTITFYDLLHKNEIFESYTMISSDVPVGKHKQIVYSTTNSPKFYVI